MNREQIRRTGSMAMAASFALILLAACGGQESPEAEVEDITRVPITSDAAAQATRDAPPPGATPEAGAATPAAGEAPAVGEGGTVAGTAIEIVSHDIYFAPTELTIPADTDVTFVLPNEGVTAHNFAIDALDIDVDLAPGATEEIVVNAPAGTYEYYCNVPGHKAAGMIGTLTVSDDASAAPAGADPAAATPAGDPAASPAASPMAGAQSATPAAEAAATPDTAAAARESAAAETAEVVSHDIYFEPAAITIPAGTDVTVSLPNEGVTAHNFSIDALDIDIDQDPGEMQEVVINAAPGTYEYYCNVPGHKAAGMVGTLTVE